MERNRSLHPRQQIEDYCAGHSTEPGPLLRALERETHLKTLAPQMLSGPWQGQLLRLLSLIVRPRRILEIGTFTGYSAICLAEGLPPDGQLHTIEADPEILPLSKKYFEKAGLLDRVELHLGDARTVIPRLEGPFDLVFIDARKQDYADFYRLALEKTRPGALLLADNVLWDGKVLDPGNDPEALALHRFNQMVRQDPRTEQVMLPIRDGLLLARRR